MAALTFDTHAFVKELTAAGFSEVQAEAVTSMVRRSRELDITALAAKGDIADVKAALADSKAEIIKWVAGMSGVQTLAVLGTVITVIHSVHPAP